MKGIMFKTEMVQANAAGLKTMTRRLAGLDFINMVLRDLVDQKDIGMQDGIKEGAGMCGELKNTKGLHAIFFHGWQPYAAKCPYGKPGELLYTRETWLKHPLPQEGYKYKANYTSEELSCGAFRDKVLKWKPAIHMPAAAARHFHRIKKIRVERIMDISAEDAIAEGIERWTETRLKSKPTRYKLYSLDEEDKDDPPLFSSCPILSFRSLWQMINGAPKPVQVKQDGKLITTGYIVYPWGDAPSMKPWQGLTTWGGKPLTVVANPWVWVVQYENENVPMSPQEAIRGKIRIN